MLGRILSRIRAMLQVDIRLYNLFSMLDLKKELESELKIFKIITQIE